MAGPSTEELVEELKQLEERVGAANQQLAKVTEYLGAATRDLIERPPSDHRELESRRAQAKLEDRLRRALAESERLESLTARSGEPELIDAALTAAVQAAEANYRFCLEALKIDSSDWARWRCARALIEFNRLSDRLR